MKYIYITYVILSSFFILSKNALANNQATRYAIFIPSNSFQQNVELDTNKNKKNISYEITDVEEIYKEDIEPIDDFAEPDDQPQKTYSKTEPVLTPSRPRMPDSVIILNAPKEEKTTNQNVSKSEPKHQVQPIIHKEIPPLVSKQKQDLDIREKFEEFLRKDTKEMLETIPFIDTTQPRFKQIYSQYGQDLNILYTTGVLAENPQQEAVLKKATDSHRFEVK